MRSLVRVCLCARGAGAGWAQGQRLGMGYREGWEELAVDRQMRLGFGHRPFGRGNPKGDSWSEKMNVWFTRVIASDHPENHCRQIC